ncbi:MAG: N-methyl-L-tryptophan oxidase [Actinobacteria bacterium]|nr:MAG: N-methyl-L-tryptophan oxidase [Actinomycetota bacterium]
MGQRREFEVAVVGLGGIGSSAVYRAAKRVGSGALGLERFELGHDRGASHDHSRIIRLSYHTPAYVRFAQDAYRGWAEVEEEAGEQLLTRTGGLDLYPETAFGSMEDYRRSLDEVGVPNEWMDSGEAMRRWPQWRLSDDVRVMFQEASGFVAADQANAAHRRLAEGQGATLLAQARVTEVREAGGLYELETERGTFRTERLILTTDAWTNELLAQLWRPINLTVTQEQVAYYAPADREAFLPERFPVWIWMGIPSFYGVPSFGEPGPKTGMDAGGAEVTGDSRSFEPDPGYTEQLDAFMRERLAAGFGPHIAVRTCLYTMTPDRDFVVDLVPGHERAAMGQGAAHAFKFVAVFGKSLVELVFDGKAESDISAWPLDREILTMEDPPITFHV